MNQQAYDDAMRTARLKQWICALCALFIIGMASVTIIPVVLASHVNMQRVTNALFPTLPAR